ncbi:glutamate-cysteine ligase catalytic subunit [Auriscalpium vulgare]|uniref:Glutamate-cysteine ligase catalytic subunit n=1 Tax=Auriscalpium vulgare TaxID=40419 RepID=A0ACB8S1I6_9AGAM|nr:glutamate-cysteine ligase catalytic subunit [Auriscalpium vulgare]
MGLLSLGTPLPWEEAKKFADHVRFNGITQFMNTWDRVKDRYGDELLWGDEVEYMVVELDHERKSAVLSLCQTDVLAKLTPLTDHIDAATDDSIAAPTFHPEYGRFMLESTPGRPYTGSLRDLLSVEGNMRFRRNLARKNMDRNQIPVTFTSFPRLGVPGRFTKPYYDPADAVSSHSLFLPEQITNPHARFPTLTANIRKRRGSKVAINLPIFVDTRTPRPFVDPTIPWQRNIYPEDPEAKNGAALTDHIYMDAMGFGMGCCCLQLTFQGCSIEESRRLYDAFIPLGPIMLALTAASPLWRGYIADVDCRWNVIAGSVDDRTEEERGLKPLKENKKQIPKSRYDSVDWYLSETWMNRPEYNDNPFPIDEPIYDRLRNHGIDDLLSKHVAHLFIRDPIVIFAELLDQDNNSSTDHFENIQSTNWQTMRFKPPPANSPIGWRVEFRSMEVQMTDFENAAFAVFIVLLSRAILLFNLNTYIPISKVDENMRRAQQRDAVRQCSFYFRKDVFPPPSRQNSGAASPNGSIEGHHSSRGSPSGSGSCTPSGGKPRSMTNCYPLPPLPDEGPPRGAVEDEYEEYTMDQIINGRGAAFPGLLGLVEDYLSTLDLDETEQRKISSYLNLVRRRANGTLKTPATWIREFVRAHPAYKSDSVVSEEINYDLMVAVDEIERGVRRAPDLLPEDYTGGQQDQGTL